MFEEIRRIIQNKKNLNAYFIKSIDELINRGQQVYYSEVSGRGWIDIDTKDDLEKAINEIYPKLKRGP